MRYAIAALLFLAAGAHAQEPLVAAGRIDLPNVEGRIDHFSADLLGRRLFLAALGNQSLEVLDAKNRKHLRTIARLAEPQGVYYEASNDRLYAACRKDGTVKAFDGKSFELLSSVTFGGDADNLRYNPREHQIIVGYGDGALGFLDTNYKKTANIKLDAHPESFQLEPNGTRVFINVPDRKQIEVADLAKNAVIAKWPVTSALQNYPMALDAAHHRLFIGCRAPARMLVIDTETGKQTASLEITGDTDDLFYDAAKKRIYVIGGEGFVDVFNESDAGAFHRAAHLPTAPGARTGLFVPDWSQLFVAVPHRGAQRAAVLVYDTK